MRHCREWMYKRRNEDKFLSQEFVEGVEEFIKVAKQQETFKKEQKLKCPCTDCKKKFGFLPLMDADTVRVHLYKFGFLPNYYCWSYHGENYNETRNGTEGEGSSRTSSNPYKDMVEDAYTSRVENHHEEETTHMEEEPHSEAKKFFDMLSNAEKPLYDGCPQSILSVASRITNLKCEYNIPHRAIDGFASLIKDICPEDNKMTNTFYSTRKLVEGLELPHQKIDVCPKGCMLFWKEQSQLAKCSICQADRYKKTANGKLIARQKLTYFPITPRLQRLYATKDTARQMTWHARNSKDDGRMTHPSHGEAWKDFDKNHQEFAKEERNVRLGLCTDGFSPFGKFGKSYSCWPVILTPYNLPPGLCMKRPFMFLSLIIPGPKNPKGNLDVFLQPLIEELKQLWHVGAMTYDVATKQNFMMKAALLWTISDFPAYGMLSGWSTAGRLACPYCMERTKSFRLQHGRKESWFDCHRQFLPEDHAFRKNKSGFTKGKEENSPCPVRVSGAELWQRVSQFPKTTDHCEIPRSKEHNWRKKSIFWELPYWQKLLIRHNLDVMHIEKNFFEQLIHTIMNVKGKTKHTKSSREDVAKYCKRRKLHLNDGGNKSGSKSKMPDASFVLDNDKRKVLCEWIRQLKFPDGYASNIGRCVDQQDAKLFGLKSHDCHVFMERLLPVALKELVPINVWKAITELSLFFRDISSAELKVSHMIQLDKDIAEIICKLEKIFPPAFFNVSEHLPVHLPYEARVGGPVQYRWMYPFERFLHHLKRKVGNKARVEGSICKAYLTEEISNFCTHYLETGVDTKAKDMSRNAGGGQEGKQDQNVPDIFSCDMGHATTKGETKFLEDKDYRTAHGYVLSNCELLRDYERVFEVETMNKYKRISISDVWSKFAGQFPDWLKQYVLSDRNTPPDIVKSLALGPRKSVRKYEHYYINGYNFHTYGYGKNKSTMSYGVCVKGQGLNYYGVLQEVIELTYVGEAKRYSTILFKCDWYDSGKGTYVHPEYKLVEIDQTKKYPVYDPFVLASQAHQVYFAPYPSLKSDRSHWRAVFQIKARSTITAPDDQSAFQEEATEKLPQLSDPSEDVGQNENIGGEDDTLIEEDEPMTNDIDDETEFLTETDSDGEDIFDDYIDYSEGFDSSDEEEEQDHEDLDNEF